MVVHELPPFELIEMSLNVTANILVPSADITTALVLAVTPVKAENVEPLLELVQMPPMFPTIQILEKSLDAATHEILPSWPMLLLVHAPEPVFEFLKYPPAYPLSHTIILSPFDDTAIPRH